MTLHTLFLSSLCFLCSACGHQQLVEGGLYSNLSENGTYSVIKILKQDPQGVHIRLYSNQFPEHPSQLDESALYMAGMNRKENESLGMGHLPISRKSFATWKIKFIKVSPVKQEELEGYEMWKEGNGGYF